MVSTKYFKTACLGGYQDSSIVYQFQSSKLFRIKTILKFMLPVIFLNLYHTSRFHTCEITSLNIALQRNNMHIKNVKFPCRTLKMSCAYKNALFTKHIMMSYLCFTIWMECRRYNVMRREMLQTVSRFADVSERVLLYGDSNLSDTENELVFKAVHKYINQTKRVFYLVTNTFSRYNWNYCALK